MTADLHAVRGFEICPEFVKPRRVARGEVQIHAFRRENHGDGPAYAFRRSRDDRAPFRKSSFKRHSCARSKCRADKVMPGRRRG